MLEIDQKLAGFFASQIIQQGKAYKTLSVFSKDKVNVICNIYSAEVDNKLFFVIENPEKPTTPFENLIYTDFQEAFESALVVLMASAVKQSRQQK
jgi:hypothetical protein